MRVGEYRDLIDDLAYWLTSAKSAANDTELDRESRRLIPKIEALRAAQCPRATPRDRQRAERITEEARQFCFSSLMYLNDNERFEPASSQEGEGS